MAPTIKNLNKSTIKTTIEKPSLSKIRKSSKPKPKPLNTSAIIVSNNNNNNNNNNEPVSVPEDMQPQLLRIAQSQRTPFEKRVWTALCQIPRGQVTTYGLLSAHLGTSPRAVGNALRRNPFAPEVPCHRVVATGGTLGGFKGSWPKDGEGITITEKKGLLRDEGVSIDDKGRVLGAVWSGFE